MKMSGYQRRIKYLEEKIIEAESCPLHKDHEITINNNRAEVMHLKIGMDYLAGYNALHNTNANFIQCNASPESSPFLKHVLLGRSCQALFPVEDALENHESEYKSDSSYDRGFIQKYIECPYCGGSVVYNRTTNKD